MTVGLLLITHENFGDIALHTITSILGVCPLDTKSLSVPFDVNPDQLYEKAKEWAAKLDSGEGVLVLTDIYGATPSNIAHRLTEVQGICVVSGMNLPMLMRVLNNPNLPLVELADKATSGGHNGILNSLSP